MQIGLTGGRIDVHVFGQDCETDSGIPCSSPSYLSPIRSSKPRHVLHHGMVCRPYVVYLSQTLLVPYVGAMFTSTWLVKQRIILAVLVRRLVWRS